MYTEIDLELLQTFTKKQKRTSKIKYICSECKYEIIESVFSYLKKDKKICGKCSSKSKRNYEEISRKTKETCLKKYGVPSNLCLVTKERKENGELLGAANPDIKQKMIQTNFEKYGIKSSSNFGRKEIQEKLKQTLLDKYGVDHNFKIKEFREKLKEQRILKNQSYRNSEEYKSFFIERYIKPKNLIVQSTELIDNETYYNLQCQNCNEEFSWSIKDRISGGHQYPFCEKCNKNGKSLEEEDVFKFIQSIYSGTIKRNTREELGGKEIDIYLPDKKFGIEYNGLYWHSGDRTRHREKWELAQKANIDLMQIWSSEWEFKRPILESIIKNRLGLSTVIYARKCKIKEVLVKEARIFADTYHLQGFYQGIYIGLYYNGELVDLSIFCKVRFGGPYKWELTRHVIKGGYRIIGGLSRELKYFRNLGYHGNIVDYCDMRIFNGKGHWSFEEVGITPPDMCYTDFVNVIPRGKYQKKNMSKIPNFKFDSTKTQLENLHDNNMDFIYGVGHKIFVQKEV